MISRDEFARLWNAAETREDAAAAIGLSVQACSVRAARMRRAGWKLDLFKRGPPQKRGGGVEDRRYARWARKTSV